MSQSTYSRLEDNDMKCTAYLTRIAEALDTTPELLQQYHVGLDSYAETDASLEKQLAGKENIIQSQADYIKFLNLFINYTQAVLRNYLRKRI